MKRSIPSPKRIRGDDLPCLHPNAAGMDIGASALVGAVPPVAADVPPVVLPICPPVPPPGVDCGSLHATKRASRSGEQICAFFTVGDQ